MKIFIFLIGVIVLAGGAFFWAISQGGVGGVKAVSPSVGTSSVELPAPLLSDAPVEGVCSFEETQEASCE